MIKSVSLDTEVVEQIEREADREERSFSQVVNRKLRDALGLQRPKVTTKPRRGERKEAA